MTKNTAGTLALFSYEMSNIVCGDGAADPLIRRKKILRTAVETSVYDQQTENDIFKVPFLVSFKWSARRTWTARRWPFMWTRSTASHATARNMGPKATASGAEPAL